jgi:hypothetical protein
MGCSCVDPSKGKNSEYTILDAQSLKNLSKIIILILYLAQDIINNPKLLYRIKRIQARIRGLLVRTHLATKSTTKFMPRDPYGQYVIVQSSKIVIK